MKILTKDEEDEHYFETVRGGTFGGLIGLGAGLAAVYVGQRRFQTIRNLTLPMKAFLTTAAGTFSAIISADRASRGYEDRRNPARLYRDQASLNLERLEAQKSSMARIKDWASANRYSLVTASWVASMGTAFAMVRRNKYLTYAQKLVQARIYAQGLTLAVLIASAALELGDSNAEKGSWETVQVQDPNDPTHHNTIKERVHHEAYAGEDLWRDMVLAEERRIEAREASRKEAAEHQSLNLKPKILETNKKDQNGSK
ncbi:hypothetical protein K3495_g11144 [Podosphaera aphanis]|nr:hypothetical protein K3495_g11144 [Podosphaera aphanis]